MKRSAWAEWRGNLKEGKGKISTDSGVLIDTQYSFSTRFEDGKGTNPEELVAAAHAGCFAMALSLILQEKNLVADSIRAKATVTLEKVEGSFSVTKSHLMVEARIPGATPDSFEQAAQTAKANCPISKLLKAEISMEAKLVS